MSAALERVIAEQQAEIDRYKAREKHNIEAWAREDGRRELIAAAAFAVINYPGNPKCLHDLQHAIMQWGYCPTCQSCPCECGHDD